MTVQATGPAEPGTGARTADPAADLDPDAVIDAMAPLLGLVVAPDYRAGIVANLKVTAALAALVLEVPLDDHAEPAAVFVP